MFHYNCYVKCLLHFKQKQMFNSNTVEKTQDLEGYSSAALVDLSTMQQEGLLWHYFDVLFYIGGLDLDIPFIAVFYRLNNATQTSETQIEKKQA